MPALPASSLGLAGPQSLQEVCDALPKSKALRGLLIRALPLSLDARVAVVRRRQFVYNGQCIRHDGNYALAKRILGRAQGNARARSPLLSLGSAGACWSQWLPAKRNIGQALHRRCGLCSST